jgi:hypothetical protein
VPEDAEFLREGAGVCVGVGGLLRADGGEEVGDGLRGGGRE